MPRLSNIGRQAVQQVEVRPIFGKGKLAQVVADLGWMKANTSAIERFNLTDRMRNARKGRKTLRFSRRTDRHDALSWLERCATIFIIRIGLCDSEPNNADGNRERRRWPPGSPIISIPRWKSCGFVRLD